MTYRKSGWLDFRKGGSILGDKTAVEVGRLYSPIKSIADVLTAAQGDIFVTLPGLVAYWPGGIRDMNGDIVDHSSAGYMLTIVGTSRVGYDGKSYTEMGPTTEYAYSAAVAAFWGFETWVTAAIRGFTVGGWFNINALQPGNGGLLSRDGIASDRGWVMFQQSTGEIGFGVSLSGSSVVSVVGPTMPLSSWHFLVGRFIPGSELAIWIDGNKTTNVTAIPAAANGAAQRFEIGRFSANNATISDGKWRDVFLCATALPDDLINDLRLGSLP